MARRARPRTRSRVPAMDRGAGSPRAITPSTATSRRASAGWRLRGRGGGPGDPPGLPGPPRRAVGRPQPRLGSPHRGDAEGAGRRLRAGGRPSPRGRGECPSLTGGGRLPGRAAAVGSGSYDWVQVTDPAGTPPLADAGEIEHDTVSTSVPGGCSTVMVALVNARSVIVSVHWVLGQPGAPGITDGGATVTTSKGVLPFLISDAGMASLPLTVMGAGFCPGASLGLPGLEHVAVTSAVAVRVTSTSPLPKPDSSPVALSVSPPSVNVGSAFLPPFKCTLDADAVVADSRTPAATMAATMSDRRIATSLSPRGFDRSGERPPSRPVQSALPIGVLLPDPQGTIKRGPRQLGLHFHDLRHTANSFVASSASLRQLMTRMGHASPRAALIYQHASREREREITKALSRRIEAVRGDDLAREWHEGASGGEPEGA